MLSIYIHIPYCVGKCLYCGFFSTQYSPEKADDFIAALEIELKLWQQAFADRTFGCIYIGGGTPTVLSIDQISRVIAGTKRCFLLEHDREFTVEANPHTLSPLYLSSLLDQGVNRLSLGFQSFSDTTLHFLGRPHTAVQSIDALDMARKAGFQNISIDLIYGIPGQSMEEWEMTLGRAIALKPEHISAYSLSLEEGSHFMRLAASGEIVLPDEEVVAQMYELATGLLPASGYRRYEISNFSLPGFECRHNQNYWFRGEYLGLGPGASSFINGKRRDTVADTEEYVRRLSRGLPVFANEEAVVQDAAAMEMLMLGLRTAEGVDIERLTSEHGVDFLKDLEQKIGPLDELGLLVLRNGRLKLTDRGFLLSDEVLKRLST
jgi:oxygen-independent coproporphyrinogen III oxidase